MNAQEKKELILQIVPVRIWSGEKEPDTAAWRFVEMYYPDYHRSDFIALADDLQKLMDEEVNGAAEEKLINDYENDIDNPQIKIDYNEVHEQIYRVAIENFLESFKQYAQ